MPLPPSQPHPARAAQRAIFRARTWATVGTAAAAALTAQADPAPAASCQASSPAHTVALVELYTSQGCSSCPPADRWLSALKAGDAVVPLSLHVAYWDYIGWTDPFARREHTERQRQRAASNRSPNIYTPGVFVQGAEMADWRNPARLPAALAAQRAQPAQASIRLQARRTSDGVAVQAQAQAPGRPEARLQLALVQDGLVTRVTAGENRHERLTNDHVVRAWSGPHAMGGQQHQIALPAGANGPWRLVAFVEDRHQVLQALSLPLAGCGAG